MRPNSVRIDLSVVVAIFFLVQVQTSIFLCYHVDEISEKFMTNEPSRWLKGDKLFANKQLLHPSELEQIELEKIHRANNKLNENHDYQQSACGLVQIIHLLNHSGCLPKAIASFACAGSCPSYVQVSTSKFWQHERSCTCCQQTGLQEATFTLDCPSLDPPYKKVKTYAPVDCICRACTDLGKVELKPQELIEALAGEQSSKV